MSEGWGGPRQHSGRKPVSESPRNIARRAARARRARNKIPSKPTPVPATVADPAAQQQRAMIARMQTLTQASHASAQNKARNPAFNPFRLPEFPKAAMPPKRLQMAMDDALSWGTTQWTGALFDSVVQEGLFFPGYAYLSQLAQRPEYRIITETIADDATRKWIDFEITGTEDDKRKAEQDPEGEAERRADPDERKKRLLAAGKMDKVKALKDDQERLEVRDNIYSNCRDDGFFGRSHLFMDFGQSFDQNAEELKAPIGTGRDQLSKGKIEKNSFRRLQVVEPAWTYPMAYNAQNPLAEDWYNPKYWYVMGTEVHATRLLKFVSHPVPDMLKPAYAFGGLANTQLAQPYVDIWLTTRESVAALIHSFSVMVLETDLATLTSPGVADALLVRAAMFNALRDNQGLMIINKNSEGFTNVSASLAGLHELQAQAQEHMASVARIPLVKFTGISPAGLNASSEGEIAVYDDTIAAYQNRVLRPNLTTVINFQQLSLFGEVDPEITYVFQPLRVLTEKEKGEQQKADAERDDIYVGMGAIAPGEVRARVIDDPELPYADLDPDDVPEPPQQGLEPGADPGTEQPGGAEAEGAADEGVIPFARDAGWSETDHPRGQPGNAGQFGTSGGGGKSPKSGSGTPHAPQYGLSYGHFTATGSAPSAPKSNVGEPLDPSKLKKVGGQMGSNPGGVYEDDAGKKFYVKQGKSKDHVRNEMTAAALYDLAGTPTLQYRPTPDGTHVATEMAKLDKDNAGKLSEKERKEAARDFAVHAWLGNWDAVGLGGDNLGTVKGKPTALDLGGALEYRAQGAPKGKAFGTTVGELDTLRDAKTNKDAAGIFGDMTPAEMRESARYVTDIPDAQIKAAVEKTGGPPALAEKLIARRDDIAAKARLFGTEGDPRKPTSTIVIPAGEVPPLKALNGVPFKAWEPPEDWASVDGQVDLHETELVPAKGKQAASGVIIREPDGRVWLVQPKDAYGGYEATFPKGRAEDGLSLQANAIKEAYEESGLKVRIVAHAGDREGDVTTTRYYFAERETGDPGQHDDETEGVVLVPPDKAGGFLNRERDRKVLAGDASWEEGKHPRVSSGPEAGQFTSGGGGGGGGGGLVDPEELKKKFGESIGMPTFKSKKEHAAHLLTKGVSTKEMLAALNWPSISMPAMAKTLGMKLEKIKVGGETKYKGTPMSKEEIYAAKVAAANAEAAKKNAAEKAAKQGEPFTGAAPQNYSKFVDMIEHPNTSKQDVADLKKYNPEWAASYALAHPEAAPPTPMQKMQAAVTKAAPATPQELEKAKKTVALQLQYVPGAPQGNAQAQKLVDTFNAKYADKPMNSQAALEQKVADFKTLQASMVPLMSAEQQKAAQTQAQAQAQAAATAEAEKKKTAAAMEKSKAELKTLMKELGVDDEAEAGAVQGLMEMIGTSNPADVVAKFKTMASGHAQYGVSAFEMSMLKSYTGSSYGAVNSALRKGSWSLRQHMYVNAVNKALKKMPAYAGASKRGTSLTSDLQALYVAGNVVEERAFTSTSKTKPWSGNTQYVIQGKSGRDIQSISSHHGEAEVLYPARTFFRVTKVEGKPGSQMTVHLTEVEAW